jgi:hypothetical protein
MDSQDIDIKVPDKWVSPLTGCTWPHGWKFGIKGKEYIVTPLLMIVNGITLSRFVGKDLLLY